ncbi:hypothetical protein CFOL_v3_33569 [Cephalotus follicularis]|uniref:CCHC-type domain-containing protein n=1 Tax=Cephalotus follicularis TaxID=3775 RepID=A0A1Q3DCH9_CEPFO|nr:hypothetical protein CFOL_v3_33569 [Cephalotus follicularis]
MQCHNCHARGHIAVHCPRRALAIENETVDSPENEDQVVNEVEYSRDQDELVDDFEEENEQVDVVQCNLSTIRDDNEWKRTTIFHTFIRCGEQSCKLVIDNGSCMNIVSKTTNGRLNLKAEPHSKPFRVSWVNKTSLPVSERCLVPMKMGDYDKRVYCDELPMDVAHVLLGRPWLYDLDVINHGGRKHICF